VTRALRSLVRACHPEPAVAVTALATALAASAGRGPAGTLAVATAVGTGQLSIGWSNDLLDRHRDAAVGRRDKPLATGALSARLVAGAAAAAAVVCVPLSFLNGRLAGWVHLVVVTAGWAYNLGLKRTLLSWLPYAVAFGLLPAFVTLGLPGHPWPAPWAITGVVLLAVGAHVANVLPDIDDDLATDVRGVPQRLGRRRARLVAAALLLTASVVLAVGPAAALDPVGIAGVAGAGVLVAVALAGPPDGRSRVPFRATLGVAALDIALLLARAGSVV
jgi:4-hydroxybenzoate polyprenyltransferase